jgi:hypothetical protein
MVRKLKNSRMGMIIPLVVFALVFLLVPAVQAAQQDGAQTKANEMAQVVAQGQGPTRATVQAEVAPQVRYACPAGCECLTEKEAKEKFGSYERCSNGICSKIPVTTSSVVPVERYCFRKSPYPAQVCPTGCSCMLPEKAEQNGYSPCGNTRITCGAVVATGTSAEASYSKVMYCYGKPSTGTVCPAGGECMTEQEAKEKYRIYSVVSKAPCGYDKPVISTAEKATLKYCIMPGTVAITPSVVSVSMCRYDPDKNVCTGSCGGGKPCSVTGTAMNIQTGETATACACPVEVGCSFDYATDTCTGSCPTNTGTCQVNTIYKDTSGKTIYGKCHCKNSPDQIPGVVATPFVVGSSVLPASDVAQLEAPGAVEQFQPVPVPSDASATGNAATTLPVVVRKTAVTGLPDSVPPARVQQSDIIGSLGSIISSFFGFQ